MAAPQAQAYTPEPAPISWGQFKNYDEANRSAFVLPPEDAGYTLRIESMSDPFLSPFVDYDDKGKEKPRAIQTMVKFTIVDYINDDPNDSVIGQSFTQYLRISMHTKATFYKMVKAAFGGDVDPSWKPNKEIEGKYVGAVLKHKEPNDQGQVYPKIESFVVNRSKKDYSAIVPPTRADDETEDVPF